MPAIPSAPVPGSGTTPGTLANRVHGRYATATLGTAVLNLFEYEITFNLDTVDSTAFGDLWMYPVALHQSFTGRARGYFTAADAPLLQTASNDTADPGTLSFNAYKSMTISSPIWTATVLITRCNFSVPMAMVEQEVEFVSVGPPTAGTT